MVYFTFNMASVKPTKCRPIITLEQQLAEIISCKKFVEDVLRANFVDIHQMYHYWYDVHTEFGQRAFEIERQDLENQLEKLTAEEACLLKKIEMREQQKTAFLDTDRTNTLPSDVLDLICALAF